MRKRNLEPIVLNWEELPLVLTVEQAARVLQVNPSTIKRWLLTGVLHGTKMGTWRRGEWRIPRENLRQFVTERKTRPESDE